MTRLIRILPLLALLLTTAHGQQPLLLPLPKTLVPAQGALPLAPDSRIIATDPELEPLARVLAEEIRLTTGTSLPFGVGRPAAGSVILQFDSELTGESYTLDVGDAVTVTGGNYHSIATGTVTLLQSLREENGRLVVPRMRIEDEPSYPYRGALIDLARKYHSPGGIEQVITLCRFYKIRFLHLHLTDDQLFMFPSVNFPQLGETNQEFARFEPASQPYSAPYTLDEMKALETFARERGVYLVPEIDLPGHSGRMIADAREIFGMPGNNSTVNIASPKTFEAVTLLIHEVMDVFESTPYIHLGADEVGLGGVEDTPEYQDAVAEFGIRNAHDLYCKFISDLHAVVAERGKQSIVWEEAWSTDGPFPLPEDVIVMSWTHGRNPQEFVNSGHRVINASWTPLYIVRNDKRPMEFLFDWQVPMFGQGHLGNDNFTVLPRTELLLGAQLCSWENSENIEIQSMRDRLALVGERTWNPDAGGSLEEFKLRHAHLDLIFDRLVHPIAIRTEGTFIGDENTFTEPITITLEPRVEGHTLKYTLDNSLPNEAWQVYEGPITIERTVHLRAGLFDARGEQQGYLVGAWFRGQIPVKPNLATHRPVTVGPGPDRNDAWGASVAVDGEFEDAGAHWASEGEGPQWLMVDLGDEQDINFVNVITYWDGSRYYQLNVEASLDGEVWETVLDFSNDTAPATAAGYSGTFPQRKARYVRVNMLKNSANPFVHIVELIVENNP